MFSGTFHPCRTGSNNTSVAEDEVMRILILLRNFVPAHNLIQKKIWDVPASACHSWDLMGKTVGTVGGGRIGYDTLLRLEVSRAVCHAYAIPPKILSTCIPIFQG